jgi:hypothetical protein
MTEDNEDTLVRVVARETEGFNVHDDASANWVIRKIIECRRYRERVEEWAAMELKRAEREEAFFIARFGLQLETWARQQIAEQHNRKSLKLPAGTLGFRTEPTRLSVTNESALLEWCRVNLPGAIQTIERVLKSSVKEHIRVTGEIPNGTDVAGGQQKFYIK